MTTTTAIEWSYGPTEWNPNPAAMWHTGCLDLIGAGHIGEVFIWKDGSTSCTGCAEGSAATARERLRAAVQVWSSSDVAGDDLDKLLDDVVEEESRSRLLAVHTADGRTYHPAEVTFTLATSH